MTVVVTALTLAALPVALTAAAMIESAAVVAIDVGCVAVALPSMRLPERARASRVALVHREFRNGSGGRRVGLCAGKCCAYQGPVTKPCGGAALVLSLSGPFGFVILRRDGLVERRVFCGRLHGVCDIICRRHWRGGCRRHP